MTTEAAVAEAEPEVEAEEAVEVEAEIEAEADAQTKETKPGFFPDEELKLQGTAVITGPPLKVKKSQPEMAKSTELKETRKMSETEKVEYLRKFMPVEHIELLSSNDKSALVNAYRKTENPEQYKSPGARLIMKVSEYDALTDEQKAELGGEAYTGPVYGTIEIWDRLQTQYEMRGKTLKQAEKEFWSEKFWKLMPIRDDRMTILEMPLEDLVRQTRDEIRENFVRTMELDLDTGYKVLSRFHAPPKLVQLKSGKILWKDPEPAKVSYRTLIEDPEFDMPLSSLHLAVALAKQDLQFRYFRTDVSHLKKGHLQVLTQVKVLIFKTHWIEKLKDEPMSVREFADAIKTYLHPNQVKLEPPRKLLRRLTELTKLSLPVLENITEKDLVAEAGSKPLETLEKWESQLKDILEIVEGLKLRYSERQVYFETEASVQALEQDELPETVDPDTNL